MRIGWKVPHILESPIEIATVSNINLAVDFIETTEDREKCGEESVYEWDKSVKCAFEMVKNTRKLPLY